MTENYAAYAAKEISPTMDAFADFLIEEVYGGELPKDFDEVTFRKAVALGGSTRGYFQKSKMWLNDPRNYLANVEANRAAKTAERAAKAKDAAAKAIARAAKLEADAEAAKEAAKAKADALAAKVADAA
jgi:aspartyl-tRNA synthetase